MTLLTLFPLGIALTALAADGLPCGPSPEAATRLLRGHLYAQIGRCKGVPVFRADSTDSTLLDRGGLSDWVVLVTRQSVSPTAAAGEWPAPLGNLYLSLPVSGDRVTARARLSSVLSVWWAEVLPGQALTEAWDGDYGAHRSPAGLLMSGLLVAAQPQGSVIGLDLHLNATEADYAALGHPGAHISLSALTGRPMDADGVLWALLPRLLDGPSSAP